MICQRSHRSTSPIAHFREWLGCRTRKNDHGVRRWLQVYCVIFMLNVSIRRLKRMPRSSGELPPKVFVIPGQRIPSHQWDDKCCHSLPDCDQSALQRIGQILVILCQCQHLQNCPAGLEKQSAQRSPNVSQRNPQIFANFLTLQCVSLSNPLANAGLTGFKFGASVQCFPYGQVSYANPWVQGVMPISRPVSKMKRRSPPRFCACDAWPYSEKPPKPGVTATSGFFRSGRDVLTDHGSVAEKQGLTPTDREEELSLR